MKALALQIIKLAVAGKLLAALQLRPALAGVHQPAGNAAAAVLRQDKDTLQIADRAGGAALHIVAPQRALGKSDRPLPFQGQQNRASVGDGVLKGGVAACGSCWSAGRMRIMFSFLLFCRGW